MSDLPPLPEPIYREAPHGDMIKWFSADQMRAYARAAIAAALAVRQGEPVGHTADSVYRAFQEVDKGRVTNYRFSDANVVMVSKEQHAALEDAHPAPAEPSADHAIALLVAAGHVSQANVDEARRIAAGLRYPHGSLGEEA
jgi:hypothetical protein